MLTSCCSMNDRIALWEEQSAGGRLFAGAFPSFEAPLVTAYREANGIILGKMNLVELSSTITGINSDSNGITNPLNAYNQSRMPGGAPLLGRSVPHLYSGVLRCLCRSTGSSVWKLVSCHQPSPQKHQQDSCVGILAIIGLPALCMCIKQAPAVTAGQWLELLYTQIRLVQSHSGRLMHAAGSSAGSASSVAAKFAPWALCEDTGGSCRAPAMAQGEGRRLRCLQQADMDTRPGSAGSIC